MHKKLTTSIKVILAGAAVVASSSAFAAGGIVPKTTWGVTGGDVLGAGTSLYNNALTLGSDKSWTDNASQLGNDAWGHAGTWYAFDNTVKQNVEINAKVIDGNYDAAFTVWATGNTPFNGGTNGATSGLAERDTVGSFLSTPAHDFNQVGQLGTIGTQWMTDPSVNANGQGNALETLAYANSGVAHTNTALNGYGQVINAGANQVASDNAYFSSLTGYVVSAAAGIPSQSQADLQFTNLAAGWYVIFLGGANAAQTLATTGVPNLALNVSAVPLPGAVYMFGAGLAGLATAARRKSLTA